MRKLVFPLIASLTITMMPTSAHAAKPIVIKLKITTPVYGEPTTAFQYDQSGNRLYFHSESNNMTPQQSQIYWIDKKFSLHNVVINPSKIALPQGYIYFNGRYFFTANLDRSKSLDMSKFRYTYSIDDKTNIKPWTFPGHKYCQAIVALGDYLQVLCGDNGIEIFTISKSDKITKLDLPAMDKIEPLWLGDHQLLFRIQSKKSEDLFSYYYLENNGTATHQFDLPKSVGVWQLTSEGWALTLPTDNSAMAYPCPVKNVLDNDGQFAKPTRATLCKIGIPWSRMSFVTFGDPISNVTKSITGEAECQRNLRKSDFVFFGFLNKHVLCYTKSDVSVHVFPTTFSIKSEISPDSFPVIHQTKIPGFEESTPEPTPTASPTPTRSKIVQSAGAGAQNWVAKCPEVVDTRGGDQPKVLSYSFDGANGETFFRLTDNGSTKVTSPSNLIGCYADVDSLNGSQANAWHIGTISRDENGYYWKNAAGVRWGLTLSGSVLITDKANPYFDRGHQFILHQ